MKRALNAIEGLAMRIEGFFFAPRAAWPFGLMRIAWAGVVLAYFVMQWKDVATYYSDSGFLPRDLSWLVTRDEWKFTVLQYSGEEWYAMAWYLALLASLTSLLLGIFPRASAIASFVLVASFHERDPMTLGGGDTVIRNVGFILMLSPGIQALSVSRLRKQYAHWRKHRALLSPVTMPTWPYRLLLWQIMAIYLTSLWWKLLGDMWLDGTAVGAALHHLIFINWSYGVINLLMPFAPAVTYATLVWEGAWLLLLIPAPLWKRIPFIGRLPIKRIVMVGGLLFHGSIAILMDVGSFSYALFAAYMGLWDDADRAWVKRMVDRRQTHPIAVLYDGSCRLCRRSAFGLAMLDAFKHLHLVDFRDEEARKKTAPHLHESQLDLAMHILLPDQTVRTGFDAFRFMSWHLPVTWPLAPFLYLPGVSHLGRRIYAWVAQNRRKCTHDRC